MMNHFLPLPAIRNFVVTGFFIFFIFSCGNEKAKTSDLPEAAEATTTADQLTAQTETVDTGMVVQQSAATPTIYSQRYDGNVPY